MAVAQDDWDQILWWYLQWLYEHLGGDPSDLDPMPPPVQCMHVVQTYYRKFGMKSGLSAAERQEFRDVIVATQLHLLSSPLDVDRLAILDFQATLASMLEDVGGDTDTLD